MRLHKQGRVIGRLGPRVKRLHVQVSDDPNHVAPTLCGIGFTSEARGCSVRAAKSIGMKAWPEFNAQGDLPVGLHLAALDGEEAAVEHWQLKRDGSRLGIVEVMQHDQE